MDIFHNSREVREAKSKMPLELQELVEKRGNLRAEMNEARQYGDDTSELRAKLIELNTKIDAFKK